MGIEPLLPLVVFVIFMASVSFYADSHRVKHQHARHENDDHHLTAC